MVGEYILTVDATKIMSSEFKELTLTSEAAVYLLRKLNNGGALYKMVRRTFDRVEAKPVALVPCDVGLNEALKFERSIRHRQHVAQRSWVDAVEEKWWHPIDRIIDVITTFLHASEGRLCVAHHSLCRASDPGLSDDITSPIKFYGHEVYLLQGKDACSKEAIESVIDKAVMEFDSIVCVLTEADFVDQCWLQQRTFTPDELITLGKNTQVVIGSAYDSESYLIWMRTI